MSGRRAQSLPPHMLEPIKPERGKCVSAICFSWKVLTCVVSHVTLVLLVVSYCVGGAYLFQHLEKPYEIEVKQSIQNLRFNLTEKIWRFSDSALYLSESDWKGSVKNDLAKFEGEILKAMKSEGWDGDEDITKSQWTFAGSLFYSIIVITTIGYGHISPRTDWGKVTTIFYAIIGIPLMLLCLSNIGDVMATSFRFIYWRVCCYVCTRTAKRPRSQRSRQRSVRSHRYSSRSQPPPFRRSMKMTQRSGNDSGFGPSMGMPHAYSDSELRTTGPRGHGDYDRDFARSSGHSRGSTGRGAQRHQQQNHHYNQPLRGGHGHGRHPIYDDGDYHTMDHGGERSQTLNRNTRFSNRQRNRDRMRDRHTVERERYISRSKQYLDDGSIDEFSDMQPPAKRAMSVRSMHSPHIKRNEPTRGSLESRASRELNRLNSQQQQHHHLYQQSARGRSVVNAQRGGRAKSMDPRVSGRYSAHYEDVDEEMVRKTPIISNRYALDDFDHFSNRHSGAPRHTPRSHSMPRSAHQRHHNNHNRHTRDHTPQPPQNRNSGRQQSRYGNHLELPEFNSPMQHTKRGRSPRREQCDYDDDCNGSIRGDYDDYERDDHGYYEGYSQSYERREREHHRKQRRERRERTERLPPSPRIMSPMGFPVQRQVPRRRPSYDYDDDSMNGDEYGDSYGDLSPKDRPVPIWLCVFLVISYILGGAVLFAYWEEWSFLDSAYFCFITLTTIGFGDFVPAKGVKDESEQSIAYCSLYLLFGIALLAMSFNLVQEEFIANVKEVARRLGILKDEEEDD